ncbi:hypothetical protein Celaphus_00017653, partial [Cervus elaphus hippelaphus]
SKVDCLEQFGQEANRAITRDDDVLCTTEYSRIVPLENGEVVVSLINGRPGVKNFTFSHALREFTKATNIRLRFLRTNTLLGHLISKAQRDPTVTRRYYYSIKDISIGGRCVCNGHAEVCNANNPEKLFRCECQHNTCGETCDHCCTGYNQRRWRPAMGKQSNECEACNCHGHSTDCYYDPDVERQQASLNIQGLYAGGGVCINCQHNTAGVNCEKCAKGYYRPYGIPAHAPDGCIPCSCHPEHVEDCEQGSGRCNCRPNFRGDQCEECAAGYYHFPLCSRIPILPVSTPSPEDPVAGDIIKGKLVDSKPLHFTVVVSPYGAVALGPRVAAVMDRQVGGHASVSSKASLVISMLLDTSSASSVKLGCDCNLEGVLPEICDAQGRCLCRPGVGGARCDACRSGFYSFPICQGVKHMGSGEEVVPGQCLGTCQADKAEEAGDSSKEDSTCQTSLLLSACLGLLGHRNPLQFPPRDLDHLQMGGGRFSTELTLVWGGNLILEGIFSPWKDIPNNEGLEHERILTNQTNWPWKEARCISGRRVAAQGQASDLGCPRENPPAFPRGKTKSRRMGQVLCNFALNWPFALQFSVCLEH